MLRIFLAEAVERRSFVSASAIKRALNRGNSAHVVVFHIVGKNHQLRNVVESSCFFIRKPKIILALSFRGNAFFVVRNLNLNVSQWKTVYKQSNVRAEQFRVFVFRRIVFYIVAREFRSNMKSVVFRIVKINELFRACRSKTVIKFFAQVIAVKLI